MASVGNDNKHKCIAAIVNLEDVQKEVALLDHATRAAEDRILLALLGRFLLYLEPCTPDLSHFNLHGKW